MPATNSMPLTAPQTSRSRPMPPPKEDTALAQNFSSRPITSAKAIATALIRSGYDLACYTYENVGYGNGMTIDQIQQDQTKWLQEVTPIIGQTDTLVYAKLSDIASSSDDYSGEIFEFLKQAGYRNFIGFTHSGSCWVTVKEDHMRHGRIMITGNNLMNNGAWFEEILDPLTVLDMVTRDKYM